MAGQVGRSSGHPELHHKRLAALPPRPLVTVGGPAPNTTTCTLPAARDSVKIARDFARTTLRWWALADLCDDVEVVVSELVTNALCHAVSLGGDNSFGGDRASHDLWRGFMQDGERPIRVRLLRKVPHIMCLVADPSDEVPIRKEPDYIAEAGRGLHVVEAMSRRWGWARLNGGGKVVWALFHAAA